MNYLEYECSFRPLTSNLLTNTDSFECNNSDLNDFFQNDSVHYSNQLLGKSYCFINDSNPRIIVCAFTISNDSIKVSLLPNARRKKVTKNIPNQKRFSSYPAVLIGRLGVNKNFNGRGIGSELMDFIKSWFVDKDNKTGCRFIVVDSYNTPEAINFYSKNGFNFLFSSEIQEKECTGLGEASFLKTRLMYFDLYELFVD